MDMSTVDLAPGLRESDLSSVNPYFTDLGTIIPSEEQPFSFRRKRTTFRLLITGIKLRTTEEGLLNIFSNYGDPISVVRSRNLLDEPIGFVEFLTQGEADKAILFLNDKAPLYWKVTYDMSQNQDCFLEQYTTTQMLRSEADGHNLACGIVDQRIHHQRHLESRPSTKYLIPPRNQSAIVSNHLVHPCVVCNSEASLVCSVCKTRYCSKNCQNQDWPLHKLNCCPPPPLEMAQPHVISHLPSHSFVPTDSSRSQSNATESSMSYDAETIRSQSSASNQTLNEARFAVRTNPMKLLNYQCDTVPVNDTNRNLSMQESETTRPQVKSTGHHPSDDSSLPPSQLSKLNEEVDSPEEIASIQVNPAENRNVLHGDLNMCHYHSNPSSLKLQVVPPKHPTSRDAAPVAIIYATKYSVKPLTLPTCTPFNVVICFSESPDQFYFQLESAQPILSRIQSKIQVAARDADELDQPYVGCPCLALFDQVWYRGEIVQLCGADHVDVRYVDFGNTAKIANTADSIRKMKFEFSQYPFLAVGAKLADVSPMLNGEWSQTEKEKFKMMVDNRTLSLELIRYEKELMCIRLKQPKVNGKDLAQYLIKANLAKNCRKQLVTDELDPVVPVTNCAKTTNSSSEPLTNISHTGAIPKTSSYSVGVANTPAVSSGRSALTPLDIGSTNSTAALPLPAVRVPSTSVLSAAESASAVTTSLPLAPDADAPATVPVAVPSVAGNSHETSVSQSVICKLKANICVQFLVNIGFDSGYCVGSVISKTEDLNILQFNSFALTLEAVADFRPCVGSVVAALSREHNDWFRACIVGISDNVYSVIYVDFGNREEGIVTVKPIPETYHQEELAVKLSPIGGGIPSVQRFCRDNLLPESTHWLEIVAKEEGFATAKFKDENFATCSVKLESWTSLIKHPFSSPVQRVTEGKRPEPGFTGEVVLVAVEELDCIYVVFDKDLPVTEEIQTEMRIVSASCPSLSGLPSVGSYVIALFPEDGEFYRAVVSSVDGESICVRYIDFGNCAVVSLKELKALPDDMLKYPACATRVALSRVPRPHGSLPSEVKSHLEGLVDQQFTVVVVPSFDASYIECIFSKDGEVLNDSILKLMESCQQHGDVEDVAGTDAKGGSDGVSAEVPEAVPDGSRITDESVQVVDVFGDFFYDEGVFQDLPAEGEFQALILSSNQPQCIMMCAADETILLKMDQLQEDLRRYSEKILVGYTPVENEVCIVKSPKDGLWYRAAVLRATDRPSVLLCILVDYGQMLAVAVKDIRRIPKRFVDYMPYMVQQAVLSQVKDGHIDEKLGARICSLLPDNSFVPVRVVARNDLLYVVDIPSVSKILLEEGLLCVD